MRSCQQPAARGDRGAALVIALMAIVLMSALGLALVLTTTTEVVIGANYRTAQEARYAADAGVERALVDLMTLPDWNPVLRGAQRSSFTDGAPSGVRALGDGTRVDLAEAVNLANCGHAAACTASEMDLSTGERPWGANNPRWTLYAYGPVSAFGPAASAGSSMYVAVFVADDTSENDSDPTTDGVSPDNPGAGIVGLRAEAYGPGGTHAVIEATLARADTRETARLVSWRLLR